MELSFWGVRSEALWHKGERRDALFTSDRYTDVYVGVDELTLVSRGRPDLGGLLLFGHKLRVPVITKGAQVPTQRAHSKVVIASQYL